MKKWIKRISLFVAVIFFMLMIGVIVEWQYTKISGQKRLNSVRTGLDTAEPGWQLDELNARRNAKLPPDDQNVALIAKKVIDQFPKEFNEWENQPENRLRDELKINHLADPVGMATFRKQFEPIKPLIVQLHAIRKYPTGGFRVVFVEPDVLSNFFTDCEKTRSAASKLNWQVILSTQDNDPNAAIEACRTGIHLRHAIGDEPTMISQLVRIAIVAIAINSTERTLCLTEPKKGLAELQADFEMALLETDFLSGLEGERAMVDRWCENVAKGSLPNASVSIVGPGTLKVGGIPLSFDEIDLNRLIYDNHAQLLEIVTSLRYAMKLQGEKRIKTINQILMQNEKSRAISYVNLFLPGFEIPIKAQIRSEAKLSTMIVAIACERYRQANGKWPDKLNDIPKEILKDIPLDPYVGGPVKYKRNKTGIVVYATGLDGIDDGGETLEVTGEKPKTDIGIQLFDPAHRRLPAEVKPKEFDDGPPPLPEPEIIKE